MCRKHGFTLVEVLFVVLIAAGILAFAVPAYKKVQERSAYNAALGTLLEISNAVSSLKQDLKISTGTSVVFPANGEKITVPPESICLECNLTPTGPWNNWVASAPTANNFMWALKKLGYLKPLKNTKGYSFYILNGTSSSDVCYVSSGTPVACMYNTQANCYKGAVVLSNGKIEQIKGSSCQN